MKRSPRPFLSLFVLVCLAGVAGGALALRSEREAALERARAEQALILSERTALMLGHLHQVQDVVLHHANEGGR